MWKISVITTCEAEDAVGNLLGEIFGEPASTYDDLEKGVTLVAVYCEKPLLPMRPRLAALRAGLGLIQHCGLKVGVGRIRAQKIPRKNWAESWKLHFKPITIGQELLVKPSWSKRRPCKAQAVVVLDPGLSFGTGQHPTTSFCLRELVRRSPMRERRGPRRRSQPNHFSPKEQGRAFLDLGTGSGILAISAAKLGYAPVHAIDFDPVSVRAARANARLNGVSRNFQVTRHDLTKLPTQSGRRYDLICANLLSTLLVEERKRIAARLKPGGTLVLAGILRSEFDLVAEAYEALGLELVADKVEREWQSGAFVASL